MAGKTNRIDPRDRAQLADSPVKLRRVTALFAPFRWQLVLVTSIIVATSVVSLGQPFLIRTVIDVALPNGDTDLLIWCVAGMVVVAVISGVFGVWQTWLATSMGQHVMHTLRTRVFAHLQAQSMAFFKRTRGGEIQSRLTNDITGMQSVVTNTATAVAANLTTAIATAVAMVALNWQLSLLSLVILPPSIWLTRRVALVRRDITSQRQVALATLLSQVEESLSVSGAQLTKTLGAGPARQRAFEQLSRDLIDLELRSKMAGKWRMASMNIAFAVIPAIIYLAAGFPAFSGGITIGTLIAFTTLQVAIFRPLMGLLNVGADVIASLALMSRIFEYLDLPVEVPPPTHPVRLLRDHVRGEIRFEDVTFRYADGDVDVLSDIDLTIPPGGSIAVVGETGSGKSTLATLLFRLADPTSGRITLDGVDLKDLHPDSLVRAIGVVSQDTYLTHASIRENLLLAKPDATDMDLWKVLVAAQIADKVLELPEGLDTVVGARGHRFSGGERQRLAVARTLLRDPKVLILDEATSALDTDTEQELQAALDVLIQGRTTVTIAHRLTTVRNADQIYVLDGGQLAEHGTHDELVAAGGRYAHLIGLGEAAHLGHHEASSAVEVPATVRQAIADHALDSSTPGAAPEQPGRATLPTKPRRTFRKARLLPMTVGLVVLAGFAMGTDYPKAVGRSVAAGPVVKASDTVVGYLNALADGDAEEALSYLAEVPEDTRFLSDAVLDASASRAPLSAVDVPEVIGEQAVAVSASYRLGRKAVSATYHLVRQDESWAIEHALTTLQVPAIKGLALPVLINGQRVRGGSVTVFPGSYVATLATPYLALQQRDPVVVTGPGKAIGSFQLRTKPTERGRRAVLEAGMASLAACVVSGDSEPKGCPIGIRWDSAQARNADSVTWQLLNDPWQGAEVFADPDRPGHASVTVTIKSKVTAVDETRRRTYTWMRRLTFRDVTVEVNLTKSPHTVTWRAPATPLSKASG